MADLTEPGLLLHAHSVPGRGRSEWEPLRTHALAVGELAAASASRFGAGEAARQAGYPHDIGKASDAFARYFRGDGPSPDHSTAGAVVADRLFAGGLDRTVARLVTMAVAGHHSGLADGAGLGERLAKPVPDYNAWTGLDLPLPAAITPSFPRPVSRASSGYRLALPGGAVQGPEAGHRSPGRCLHRRGAGGALRDARADAVHRQQPRPRAGAVCADPRPARRVACRPTRLPISR